MNLIKPVAGFFKILGIVIIVALVLITTVVALGQLLRDERQLAPWGLGFFLITSGSMEPNIPVGSLILVHRVSADDINEGDVLTFFSGDGHGAVVTHRVMEIIRGEDGGDIFITRGDANNVDDTPLSFDNVIGKTVFSVPGVDRITAEFQNVRLLGIVIISVGFTIAVFGFLTQKSGKREQDEEEKQE